MKLSYRPYVVFLSLVFSAVPGVCVTPGPIDLQRSLSCSSVVLVGRVNSVQELSWENGRRMCDAQIQVVEFLKGFSASETAKVKLRFVCESHLSRTLPVDVFVTDLVLIAVDEETGIEPHTLLFDSDLDKGTDAAFALVDVSEDEYLSGATVNLADVFLRTNEVPASRSQLVAFSSTECPTNEAPNHERRGAH